MSNPEVIDYKDPKVWGPHFWFMMRCIANTYPDRPNKQHQKYVFKFYTNLKNLLPCHTCREHYVNVLNIYDVKKYVGSRDSLIKWVELVYSYINEHSKNPQNRSKSLNEPKFKNGKDIVKIYRPALKTPKCKTCGGSF